MEETGRDRLFQWKNFVVKHLKLETNTYYMDIFSLRFRKMYVFVQPNITKYLNMKGR